MGKIIGSIPRKGLVGHKHELPNVEETVESYQQGSPVKLDRIYIALCDCDRYFFTDSRYLDPLGYYDLGVTRWLPVSWWNIRINKAIREG